MAHLLRANRHWNGGGLGDITLRWPVAVDLFSGMGGMTLGLRLARFRPAVAVEISDLAADTYQANFPSIHVLRADVRNLRGAELLAAAQLGNRRLDLLAGCPPCQGFSRLRTRNSGASIPDPRNDLLFEFVRLVEETRPLTVLMENVPRLLEDSRYQQITDRLQELGFRVWSRILNAMHYGVPQRRRRLILIASRVGAVAAPVPASEALCVRSALAGLSDPGRSNDPAHDHGEKRSTQVQRVIAAIPPDGGSRMALPDDLQLACHEQRDGYFDVYGRMAWDAPSPTITGGCINPSKGRFLHPEQDRAVTVREAAVLQGFPTRFTIRMDRGKYAAAEMVGNALPPEFVRRQAMPIRQTLAAYRRRTAPSNRRRRHQLEVS